jgi:hypothetical protein
LKVFQKKINFYHKDKNVINKFVIRVKLK